MKHKIIRKTIETIRPSPTQLDRSSSRSRGFLERISGLVPGSMTVEAALLLPLVLGFCINLSTCIEMIRLHTNMESALTIVGDEVTCIGGPALSELYIYGRLLSELGEEYLSGSPISGGALGILVSVNENNEVLEISVDYMVKPELSILPFSKVHLENVYCGRIWTGYDPDRAPEIVYVTRYGEVYHRDIGCRYINISLQAVLYSELENHVNKDGRHYTRCNICGDGDNGGIVYITDGGDRYHLTDECAAIKRNVYMQSLAEAAINHKPCSNCCIRDTVLT